MSFVRVSDNVLVGVPTSIIFNRWLAGLPRSSDGSVISRPWHTRHWGLVSKHVKTMCVFLFFSGPPQCKETSGLQLLLCAPQKLLGPSVQVRELFLSHLPTKGPPESLLDGRIALHGKGGLEKSALRRRTPRGGRRTPTRTRTPTFVGLRPTRNESPKLLGHTNKQTPFQRLVA